MCRAAVIARNAPVLEQIVAVAEKLAIGQGRVLIDVSRVSNLDTFGAWFIERLRRNFNSRAELRAALEIGVQLNRAAGFQIDFRGAVAVANGQAVKREQGHRGRFRREPECPARFQGRRR